MKKVSQLGLDTVTLRLEGPAIIIIISIIIIMLESQMMLIPCVIIQICFVYELLLQLLHKLNFQGWFLLSDLAHWPSDPLSMTMLLMMRGDMGDQTRAGSQSEISFATEKITQTDGNSSCKHFLFIFSHIYKLKLKLKNVALVVMFLYSEFTNLNQMWKSFQL